MKQQTMKALVYHGPDTISLDEVPVPKIEKPTDVIGKVALSAICTSDVHIMQGHMPIVKPPLILGHEFVVEVAEVGPAVEGIEVGKHYAVLPASFCGECDHCKAGRIAACLNGGTFGVWQNGCQAEYIRIPDYKSCMIPVPEGISDAQIILLGDMLATAWFGIVQAGVKEGQTVAVVGLGPVGMCACELLTKHFGCKVVAITRSMDKIALAIEHGVAIAGISPTHDDVEASVAKLTNGKGFPVVIETPGTQSTMDLACSIVGFFGTISTIAIFGGPIVVPMNEIIYRNVTIKMGVQQLAGIEEMLDDIVTGKIDPSWMLTHKGTLDSILKGYEVFGGHTETCIKWVIEGNKE
ncbi:MAG: alcohol dehydrogenase catalytic domain-containing protein [Coriobacteriales bacterium]|jgi:alcohol dehydrogenase|nr:alcohol dehydrogenase catalytic domain-containing protein [Coriobacteriales bacterium]